MAAACRALNTPVISGNVSLYNEIKGKAIYPTPVVGMVGLIEDIDRHCTSGFKDNGDLVFLLGGDDGDGLGGSEYLELVHGVVAGRPVIDLDAGEEERNSVVLSLIRSGVIKSAHDCSDGGLAVALAECCIMGGIGIKGRVEDAAAGWMLPFSAKSRPGLWFPSRRRRQPS